MTIRPVQPQDCPALLEIYSRYIETGITFEYDLPTREAFSHRIAGICRDYPYLVCQEGEHLLGYAYAHCPWERAAFQWNAELSIYLAPEARGHGLGRRLYAVLEELLLLQRVDTLYGVVTLPNPPSEALHRAAGFIRQAVFPSAGFKAGAWRDVAWFRKEIAPHPEVPQPFLSIRRLPPQQIQAVLDRHNGLQ